MSFWCLHMTLFCKKYYTYFRCRKICLLCFPFLLLSSFRAKRNLLLNLEALKKKFRIVILKVELIELRYWVALWKLLVKCLKKKSEFVNTILFFEQKLDQTTTLVESSPTQVLFHGTCPLVLPFWRSSTNFKLAPVIFKTALTYFPDALTIIKTESLDVSGTKQVSSQTVSDLQSSQSASLILDGSLCSLHMKKK